MSDEEKRWPFDGFYLKLAEAQREYEQEQHIDPASLTEEERQQKLQEILDCIKASRKKKKEADEQLDPIVPEEEPETAGATPQPAKQYINAQILGRKRPLDGGDTCAVYLLHYPKERLKGELKKSRSISWNRSRHIENGLMIGRHGRHICISLKQWKY